MVLICSSVHLFSLLCKELCHMNTWWLFINMCSVERVLVTSNFPYHKQFWSEQPFAYPLVEEILWAVFLEMKWWVLPKCSPKWLYHLAFLPIVWEKSCCHILSTLVLCTNQKDVECYCNLHFLIPSEVEYLFISLLAYRFLFMYLVYFLVELLAFHQFAFKNIF